MLLATLLTGACGSGESMAGLARERALQAEAIHRADWARHYWQLASAERGFDDWNRLAAAWAKGSEADLSLAESAYRRHLTRHPEDVSTRRSLLDVLIRSRRVELAAAEAELLPDDERAAARQRLLEWTDVHGAWAAVADVPDLQGASAEALERFVRLGVAAGRAASVLEASDRLLRMQPLSERVAHLCLRVARESSDDERTSRALARVRLLSQLAAAVPGEELVLLAEAFPELSEDSSAGLTSGLTAGLASGLTAGTAEEGEDPVNWRIRLRWMRAKLAHGEVVGLRPYLEPWARLASVGALRTFAGELARAGFGHLAEEIRRVGRDRFPARHEFWVGAIADRLDRGDLNRATELLDQARSACGEVVPLLVWEARRRLQSGDEVGAENALRRAVDLAPWHLSPTQELAELRVAQGRREEAADLLASLPPEHSAAAQRLRDRWGLP